MTDIHPDDWFDKSIFPKPCDSMHYLFTECETDKSAPCVIEPISTEQSIHTEASMLTLLHSRYGTVKQNYPPRFVLANHVRDDANRAGRTADFIAQDTHGGGYGFKSDLGRYPLHGHEIKVSRADWLSELRDPNKAEAFRPYMHYWWLVVPDKSIVKPGEPPEGWGLMAIRGNRLAQVVEAPLNSDIQSMPTGMRVAMFRSVLKTTQPVELPRIVRPRRPRSTTARTVRANRSRKTS